MNTHFSSATESSSSSSSSSYYPSTTMNVPPAVSTSSSEEDQHQLIRSCTNHPRRRVSPFDGDRVRDLVPPPAANLVSDDEEEDDETILIHPTTTSPACGAGAPPADINTKKRRRSTAATSTGVEDSSSTSLLLKSCLKTSASNRVISNVINDSNKRARALPTGRDRKLLRFYAVPTVLGRAASVEDVRDVWYSAPELVAIRRECRAAIARAAAGSGAGRQQQQQHTTTTATGTTAARSGEVAREIMRLYNNDTNGDDAVTVSDELVQLRGLERWTSQLQYQVRQMASRTLRSELYIAQSSRRHHCGDTVIDDDVGATAQDEQLAEISRTHSARAVAWAIRLARIDASTTTRTV